VGQIKGLVGKFPTTLYGKKCPVLDYDVWGAMLEKYHKLQPKPKTVDELKILVQQEHMNKTVANFIKRFTA